METSLKQLIQQMSQHGRAELVQGKVISTSPLKIQILNDSKLVVSERITVIPRHLTDYETEMDIVWGGETSISSNTTTADAHAHKLLDFNIYKAKAVVRNALKVGELVHIIVMQSGKKYYVLDRVT